MVDLWKAFGVLQQYKIKLNPSKCAFGIGSSKFLGLIVSKKGSEANLEKIKVVIGMIAPKNLNKA